VNKLKVVVIGVLVVALLVSGVYAANNVMKSNSKYEAMISGSLKVTGSIALVEENHGFVVMPFALTPTIGLDPENPVYFKTDGTNAIVATGNDEDDWVYDVRLFTTENTPANAVFEVEFRGPAGGYIADLYIATGETVVPGAQMVCAFRIGPEISVPYAYRLTVQQIS
jgi:hypothetical protein